MNPSLRTRLFAVHGLIIVSALTVLALVASWEQRRWLLRHDARTLERAARLMARDLAMTRLPDDWSAQAKLWGDAFGARVTLVDRGGRVIGDSEVPAAALARLENHADRPEVRAALAGRVGQAVRRSATVGNDRLYVAIPVRAGPLAVLRLSEELAVISQLNTSLFRASLLAMFAALAAALALVFWLTSRHAARLAELGHVAQRIGAGEPARARELPADELGRLGRELNRMAAELKDRLGTLERERDEREQILAHMKAGVALLDGSGRVLRLNRSFLRLLGSEREPRTGLPLHDLVREPELDELVRSARKQRRPVEGDLRLWAPGARLLRANVAPLGAGTAGTLLIVLHDLTEIETLNRMRQDFVANVSHELRTPVTSLRGYAETLLEGGLEDAENREEFVRVIRDQAVRLGDLIEDLLSLATLERPGASLKLERFDLRALVERQVAAVLPGIRAGDVGVELEAGEPLEVTADRARLDQVLANLLDNAVKYTERGRVTVRLHGDARRVACEIEDTGAGIPAEDLARIFERFYRVDKARSREKGGTGLGLAIVKHIVALHGGDVSVRSRPGHGSVFRFEFPRHPERGAS